MLKGKETPLFIKAYAGLGRSKCAEVNGSNTFGSLTFMQTTSDVSLIYGIGAGIYVPIKEKYFIEIEGNYLVSNGKPSDTKAVNENTKEEFLFGDITYNPTVINLNIGIGLFLFRE